MTTTIKVTSHNFPARVEVIDNGEKSYEEVLRPEDGEKIYHCTTTRELRITDVELDYGEPKSAA